MKTRDCAGKILVLGILSMTLIINNSCSKLPEPAFSYTPTDNPEAGEPVQFINSTTNATSYSWDFGDGGTSTLKDPEYVYNQAGIYSVRLTAYNDAGDKFIIQPVTINEATILGFLVTDSTGEIALSGAEVWVYDNEFDWNNLNDPQYSGNTDNDGFIAFFNLEPITYYIYVIKMEAGGFWGFAGYTDPLDQNEINAYSIDCLWFDDKKKSTSSMHSNLELISKGSYPEKIRRKE